MRHKNMFPAFTAIISLASLNSTAALAQALDATQPPTDPRAPIIDDSEFDATIPAIDDNPDAPMGSVEDWAAEQKRLERQAQQEDARDGMAVLPELQDADVDE